MDQVDFAQNGNAQQPSGSVWGSCPGPRLNDIGAGYYAHEDFTGGTENFADLVGVGDGSPFTVNASASTTIAKSATAQGGILQLAVTNTDNNSAAIFKRPFAPLTLNSGIELWYEARFALNALGDGNMGIFAGFVAGTSASKDTVANNPDSVAAGLIGDTLVGFTMQSNNSGLLYAVIAKDGGGTSTLFSDVGHSSAIPTASQFTMADGVFHKFGLRFDGKKTMYFYVDGYQIGKTVLTTSNANSSDILSPIFCVKTGAATARQINVDWVRAAARTRR
jgi:hypothetical protein